MTRLVIDTDPGVDDAHAIMMAFAYPGVTVEAITTVAGNASQERSTANACTILDVLNQEQVPVYPGCASAIVPAPHDATYFHGLDGLGNGNFPPSARRPLEEHAVLALIRLANEAPGELTLVAIGPLTNVALATRLDPALPSKYRRLVVMGGAIHAVGNIEHSPTAEFNVWTDPEAAAIVFDAWPGLTLISWETTLQYPVQGQDLDDLMTAQGPRAEFFQRITPHVVDFVETRRGERRLSAPDALAVAAAIEPEIVTRAEMHAVQVELAGRHTRGQTTVDWGKQTSHEPKVNIVLEVNRERFMELFRAGVI